MNKIAKDLMAKSMDGEPLEHSDFISQIRRYPNAFQVFTPEELDNFVELIVRECALASMHEDEENSPHQCILRHFGLQP